MNNPLDQISNPERVGFSGERLSRITAYLEGCVNRGEIPGFIATVARRSETVYYHKSGWMDVEAQKPMEDDSIFMIASMTKPITAVAAMLLYEEGYFHLNTPISEFIPAFVDTPVYAGTGPQGGIYLDDREGEITFRHLFTHSAGFSYGWDLTDPIDRLYQEAGIDGMNWQTPNRELAELLAQLPLAYQPGSHWRYSLSIDVLGALVEIISGLPLRQFFKERLFEPLGMVDTDFYVPEEKQDRLTTVYGWTNLDVGLQPLKAFKAPPFEPTRASGGGGLWSTAPDYARFAQILVNQGELDGVRLLSPATVKLFSLNQCPEAALPYGFEEKDVYHAGYGYSLGTRVLMDVAKSGMAGSVGEFGWDGKFHTYFWVDPVEELYGLLMVQLDMEGRHPSHNHFKQLTYQAMV